MHLFPFSLERLSIYCSKGAVLAGGLGGGSAQFLLLPGCWMSLNSSLKASGQESLRAVYTLYGKWLQVVTVSVPVPRMCVSQRNAMHTMFTHTLVYAMAESKPTVTTHSFSSDDKAVPKLSALYGQTVNAKPVISGQLAIFDL